MAPNNHWPNLFKLKPSSPHRQINTSSTMSAEKSSVDEGTQKLESNEPKARWKPLPEQIEILEYIFKSGMKNPGREDIQSITKLLQKYGHVGEINIYYWFQNKKSKTMRERHLESASRPSFTPNIREFSSSQYHNAVTVGGVIQSDSSIIHTGTQKLESNQPKARWKPLPEQIEILEYIFESGMKNPGREDIQSITKLLQKYGHVGEINIYYWFQNKKSKTKRERRLESASRPSFTPNIREFSSSPSALFPEQMNGTTSAQYHNAVTMGGEIQSDSSVIHTESGAKKRNASVLTVCMNGIPFDASMGPRN